MSKLANFSIETDSLVFLQFKNGREARVPVGQLSDYLAGSDLARVNDALQLRQSFIKTHMPKISLLTLVAGGALAMLLMGSHQMVANLVPDHTQTTQAPAHDALAGGINEPNTGPNHQAAVTIVTPAAPVPVRLTSTPVPTPTPAPASAQPRTAPALLNTVAKTATHMSDLVSNALTPPPQAAPSPEPTITPAPTPTISPAPLANDNIPKADKAD